MTFPLPDVTLAQVLQRLAAAAIVAGVYGYVVAAAAALSGDRGPTFDGRRTLNPLDHADVLGVLAAVFYRVTWVRPLDVDFSSLKRPRLAPIVIVLASVVAMVALAALAVFLRQVVATRLVLTAALQVTAVLTATAEVALATAVIGLLPVPPLLGSVLWGAVVPGAERHLRDRRVLIAGYALVLVLLVSGLALAVARSVWRGFFGLLGF